MFCKDKCLGGKKSIIFIIKFSNTMYKKTVIRTKNLYLVVGVKGDSLGYLFVLDYIYYLNRSHFNRLIL